MLVFCKNTFLKHKLIDKSVQLNIQFDSTLSWKFITWSYSLGEPPWLCIVKPICLDLQDLGSGTLATHTWPPKKSFATSF